MMKNRLICILVAAVLCLTAVSCRKYSGFKHRSHLYYQFHQLNEEQEQPQTGDFVMVNMALRMDDTVLSPMTQNNMLMDELYKGDIYTALRMMHIGDSATFIFDGRKFYEEFLGMGEYPYGKKPIYADIKLLRIMSKQNLEKAEERYEEHKEKMRLHEDSIICDYANKHHLDNKVAGMYCIYLNVGDGEKAIKGQTVEILYSARLLDNTKFDGCEDPNNTLTVEVGAGQVAPGLDIMLRHMREGDKMTMVVPSSLGFGEKGSMEMNIPPYTPLVFDVEMLRILPMQF